MGQRRKPRVAQSRAALFSVTVPPARGVTRRAETAPGPPVTAPP